MMQDRLRALGGDWSRVTAIDVYTAESIHGLLAEEILRPPAPPPSTASTGSRAARRSAASTSRWTCAASPASWCSREGDRPCPGIDRRPEPAGEAARARDACPRPRWSPADPDQEHRRGHLRLGPPLLAQRRQLPGPGHAPGARATSSRASFTAWARTSRTIRCGGRSRRAIGSRSPSSTRATAATGASAASITPARIASAGATSSRSTSIRTATAATPSTTTCRTGHYVFKVPDVPPRRGDPARELRRSARCSTASSRRT